MTRVLVVDDEPQIRRALDVNLRGPRLRGGAGRQRRGGAAPAAADHPDVVLLDLGLPGIDGIEVVRGLRGWTDVPIIVLSVRDAESDKVAALDAGADDYVTKPFGMDELLARLRAAAAAPAGGQRGGAGRRPPRRSASTSPPSASTRRRGGAPHADRVATGRAARPAPAAS